MQHDFTKAPLSNVDTDDLLFERESPRHIIGFSKVYLFNRDTGRLERVEYRRERIRLPVSYPDIRKYVTSMIHTLTDGLEILKPNEVEAVESEYSAYSTYKQRNKLKLLSFDDFVNSSSEAINSETEDDGGRQDMLEDSFPYLEVDRPTLFIFATNIPNQIFVPNYIAPMGNDKLDPHMQKPRLWHDGRILGVYSDYSHGDPGSYPGKYKYFLVAEGAGVFAERFDPGNGNGGNSGIP